MQTYVYAGTVIYVIKIISADIISQVQYSYNSTFAIEVFWFSLQTVNIIQPVKQLLNVHLIDLYVATWAAHSADVW